MLINNAAVNQNQKHVELSNRYTQVNTRQLIDIAEKQGYTLASVRSSKGEYGKHEVKLNIPFESREVNKEYKPQIIIINSHDGTSSLRILGGVFRLVCSNGLVVGNTLINLRLRHVGLKQEEIAERLDIAAKKTIDISSRVEVFRTKLLSADELDHFAHVALEQRAKLAGLTENEKHTLKLRNIYKVLQARRSEDRANTLWEVFNRVQENIVRGNRLEYIGEDNKFHTLRGVTGIMQSTAINQSLWELTESMAA